jgi:hypothetical protein
VVAAADDGGGAHAGEQVQVQGQVPWGLKLTDSHSNARGQQQHGLRRTKTNREGEMEQSSGRLYPEDEEARTGAVLYVPQGGMTKWAAAFACLPISTSTQEMAGRAGGAGGELVCAEVSGLGQRHSQQFSSAVAAKPPSAGAIDVAEKARALAETIAATPRLSCLLPTAARPASSRPGQAHSCSRE